MPSILLADDHAIVRRGLKIVLQPVAANLVFHEVPNGREAITVAELYQPELAILDISMPGMPAFACVKKLKEIQPSLRIIMHSMNDNGSYEKMFLEAGASAYISKASPVAELKQTVFDLLNGTFQPVAIKKARVVSMQRDGHPFDILSGRQKEITRLLVEGKSIKDICAHLQLHSSTVSTQKVRIFEKLKIRNILELYALAKHA